MTTHRKENRIDKTIKDVLSKLVEQYNPEKIILFGSHAYGEPNPDSDIDLLIIKETSERFIDRWMTVRRILSDPHRQVSLETLILTPQEVSNRLALRDQFVDEIVKKGHVLYAR